jgi:hypothetical protein
MNLLEHAVFIFFRTFWRSSIFNEQRHRVVSGSSGIRKKNKIPDL